MLDVKENFKNKFQSSLFCDLSGENENQQHILECQVLINNCEALFEDSTVQNEDIFGAEKKQLLAV